MGCWCETRTQLSGSCMIALPAAITFPCGGTWIPQTYTVTREKIQAIEFSVTILSHENQIPLRCRISYDKCPRIPFGAAPYVIRCRAASWLVQPRSGHVADSLASALQARNRRLLFSVIPRQSFPLSFWFSLVSRGLPSVLTTNLRSPSDALIRRQYSSCGGLGMINLWFDYRGVRVFE